MNGAAAIDKAKLNGLNEEDSKNGAVVHTFDPNSTPQEKAAAAAKGREKLESIIPKEKQAPSAQELRIDTSKSNVVPTITVSDADTAPKALDKPAPVAAPPILPGDLPAAAVPVIPDWYKVGWRQVGGIDDPIPLGDVKEKGILDAFLSEQFYGDWYHSAALIVFAVFTSHFLTRFGFGWGWLFILLAICNTYYSTSMARLRHRARDDIQRELLKTGMTSEHESAEWMNNFLERFWKIYEPVLSATIVATVDQVLSTATPAFLDSLKLSTFTLGTKAPRIDKVRTFPKTDDDVVMMDWGISFTPNDVSDLTQREQANKVNPRIVLDIRVGAGLATAAIPILLEDISFTGLMRIRLKLMTPFPHIQIVDISFMEKPLFDYVLKPIGGDAFGFDIAHIPGLAPFIRDTIHSILGPMMYDPNVFTLNLEQLLSGVPLDTAIGILQVTVRGAKGIKSTKFGGGTPDPYVKISFNDRETVARTHYKHSTYNPTWGETKFLLIKSLQETIVFKLFDYNEHRKDADMGVASFELSKLIEDATLEDLIAPILINGKNAGDIKFDLNFYPVLKPAIVDGVAEELPETTVGIVRFVVHQAKELDQSKSMSGELNPFARIIIGGEKTAAATSPIRKHTNAPVWETSTEFLCSDKASSVITVKVVDERDFLSDPLVGYLSIRLEDLLAAKLEAGKDWWPLSGCKSGKVRLSAEWKPLDMAGSLEGAGKYTPPIGVVRLHVQKATDLKNLEATLGGKSDPYLRVQIDNITKGRTEVINNNLNPVWDQILYIPVHSIRQNLLLECMDYQNLTKDRSLGTVELHVNELAKKSDSDPKYPYESLGKKAASEAIHFGKGAVFKGTLHYTAEFIPAFALRGVSFDSSGNEIDHILDGADGVTDGGDSVPNSASDIEEMPIPFAASSTPVPANAKNGNAKNAAFASKASVEVPLTGKGNENNTATAPAPEETGIPMSKIDLLKEQSGIIVLHIISGSLRRRARLEVLLDEGYWPAFSTLHPRSAAAQWRHVGEGFIKELDFAQVCLRLNDSDEGTGKDVIVGEYKGGAKAFLEATLEGAATFTLVGEDNREKSTIQVESRYIPVPVKLEARESVNNQGILRVDLIDAKDLRAADRGGKSDPYTAFTLNGEKVFKSQTKKKTLNPEWQENFTINVPSRVAADFTVEVFDWDQLGTSDSLGLGKIDLADLEAFQAIERVIPLSDPKQGPQGSVRVRLVFQPEIIAKARKNTSTFSAAGRAMTQVAGLPLGAGKGVLQGVGGIFKKEKDFAKENQGLAAVPELPSGQASKPVGQSANMGGTDVFGGPTAAADLNSAGPPKEPGTLTVSVLDAKDLAVEAKVYCTVRVGEKEHKTKNTGKTSTPEWNETFSFAASVSTTQIHVQLLEHRTIGKDKVLGETDIDIWRHLQAGAADVFAELSEGHGLIRLRLDFNADGGGRASTLTQADRLGFLNGSPSKSPSKFSLK